MAKQVFKNIKFLKKLSKSSKKDLKALVRQASIPQLQAVCECCLNVVNRNCPISKPKLLKLRRHKAPLLNIAFRKDTPESKRRLLIQKGSGFLPVILPIALSYLAQKVLQ
jgi:hypothetical protein